jgi:hypothetical protein
MSWQRWQTFSSPAVLTLTSWPRVALARHGSLSAVARALSVNRATRLAMVSSSARGKGKAASYVRRAQPLCGAGHAPWELIVANEAQIRDRAGWSEIFVDGGEVSSSIRRKTLKGSRLIFHQGYTSRRHKGAKYASVGRHCRVK